MREIRPEFVIINLANAWMRFEENGMYRRGAGSLRPFRRRDKFAPLKMRRRIAI
jgi:hypothetical protein